MSPYDELRTEYHLEEWQSQGKVRRMDLTGTVAGMVDPGVRIIDQDAKGLLGRMVCAYGPVNKILEMSTFPSADPDEAFKQAAGKPHHTIIDAIWGYTQFMVPDAADALRAGARSASDAELRRPNLG